MNIIKTVTLLIMIMMMTSCGRSKDAHFYVLNPLPATNISKKQYHHLQLGIDKIHLPAWLDKPQLMIHTRKNTVSIEEYHQWAEAADKNIEQVITTNLAMLLPGAIIENAPMDVTFKPTWLLRISIDELSIDNKGNSLMRANYLIYHQENPVKKDTLIYHSKIKDATIEQLVCSINTHINQLTTDIAKTLSQLKIIS